MNMGNQMKRIEQLEQGREEYDKGAMLLGGRRPYQIDRCARLCRGKTGTMGE